MKSIDIHRYPVRLRKLTLLVAAAVVLALGYGAGYGSDEIFLNRGDDGDGGWGQAPVVTTTSATLVDQWTVDAGGYITDDGGSDIFNSGLVWSPWPEPTIEHRELISYTGFQEIGPFTSQMYYLKENTHYYFRAWASNTRGRTGYGETGYGEQKTFITGSTASEGTSVWTEQDAPDNPWWAVASSSDGTRLVAVIENGYIHTSSDSGVTWTAREDSRHWSGVASSSDGTKLVAVVYNGKIYTSTDSGVTWTAQGENKRWSAVASSFDGTKLVAVNGGGGSFHSGKIYTSTDSGVTWTDRAYNARWAGVASSSDGTRLVAVGDWGYIHTSSDSGETWTSWKTDEYRNWNAVASSADGTKLVAVEEYIDKSTGFLGGYIFTGRLEQ